MCVHAGERLVWVRVIQNWWTMYACHVARVCDPATSQGRFAPSGFARKEIKTEKQGALVALTAAAASPPPTQPRKHDHHAADEHAPTSDQAIPRP